VPDKSVTDLRATIEAFAAKEAAKRIRAGAKPTKLLDCYTEMQQLGASGDYEIFAKKDKALHEAIIDMADVEGLPQSWRIVFSCQSQFRLRTLRECWPDLSVLCESHREMVDAIVAGQPEDAHNAALNHLDAIWFRLAIASDKTPSSKDSLSRACAWLAFHFSETVRLPQLATEIAGCSAGHLARLFRDELGLSYSDYLIELRLQKASQLLQTSSSTIRKIAFRVGYRDASRFSMHFHRRFGMTPKEHRKTFSLQILNR